MHAIRILACSEVYLFTASYWVSCLCFLLRMFSQRLACIDMQFYLVFDTELVDSTFYDHICTQEIMGLIE